MWHRIQFSSSFSGTGLAAEANGIAALKWLQRRCSETRELELQVRPDAVKQQGVCHI